MAQIIQTIFQFKRGDAERWNELNPILAEGEPGFELDTNKFKIGNGINTWKELPYKGEANIVNAQTRNDFPAYGNENAIYKAQDEKLLYQWNPDTSEYEVLGAFGETDNGDPITIDIELSTSSMNPVANKVITMALQDFAEDHYTKQEVDTAIENTNKRIDLLEGTTHFRGIYPNLNDETLNADLYEFSAGDIFIVENAEYICTTSGNLILLEKANYEKLGDVSAELERISALEEKVGNEKNGEIEATGLYQAIAGLENTKVDKTDIINTLDSTALDKPLSAAMGKELNSLIKELSTNINDAYVKQTELNDAVNAALETAKESGEFDGQDGGHYTPSVKDNGNGTMTVTFTASESDMPDVSPVTISLPVPNNGKDGDDGEDGGYYTPSVNTISNNKFKISFTASKTGMPSVADVTITLPTAKDGADGVGISSVVQTTTSTNDGGENVITVTLTDNTQTTFKVKNGSKGSVGRGISKVEKTSTSELTDTYTITYTDGTTSTFTVVNGENGTNGVGIKTVAQTTTSSADSGENVITVTLTNGSTSTLKVKNGSKGSKGDTGNGIKSIAKTSTSGLVDTYTITFTDNTTTTFTVTNGKAGTNGTSVTVSKVTESTESGGSNVVEFSDGKTLTVKNGKDGKDGVGAKGDDGYTPVPGVDYPTDAQIDTKIAAALAERNQLEPLIAESVDWLNENGDPTKVYIVPNVDGQGGKVYAYAEKTIVTEPEQPETPADVNVLEGMTLRVGRYGSTGTWTSTGSYVNNRTTELIECDDDDRITIENWLGGNTSMYISLFDASQAWIGKLDLVRNDKTNQFSTSATTANSWADKANYPYSATTATSKPLSEALGKTGIAYFTVCSGDTNVDSNNQAINGYAIYVNKGSGSSTITHSEPTIEIVPDWYVFTDFVPTDDARIDELNRAVSVLDTANAALNRRVDALEENGVTSGGATSISKAQALLKIRNWDKPIYERLTPFLLDEDLTVDTTYPKTYTDSADSDGSKRRVNVQKVYDEYNALCTAHPDFVRDITDMKHGLLGATETTFGGLCSDGIQYVRVYEFCEREGRHSNTANANNWSETKPTFVIITGIHWEYNGVYSMLYALKEITENPKLRDMRRNCRFIVIPMSNPYTFTAYKNSGGGHYNANGVEIHNNFEVEFNNAIDSTHGTAPLTEVETRYIDNAIKRFKDTAVCLLSGHSCASPGANFIWGSTATKFMCNVSMRLVDMMSNAWDVKYDGTDGNYNYRELIDQNKSNGNHPQDDGDYRCGFASLSTSSGTEAKQATLYGVQGINVEVFEWFYPFDPSATNKLLAYSRGAEVYVNLLRLLAATYDHNDRDKYAPKPAYKIQE